MQTILEMFPQLQRPVRGRRLVYLDSAATALKPLPVIEAVREHMANGAANVHRGAHWLSDEATERYENVREQARAFLGASAREEIVFTRGTTEGINLVAATLGRTILNEGDEILLSQMEHHSNIVPWQMIARERGARVRFAPVQDDGTLDFAGFQAMLSSKTKIVALVHLSNALGTLNPLKGFFSAARAVGAVCVADGAQSASYCPLRVSELGADFLVLSGHKIFGPTGVGLLYGKKEWLERLPPYQGGGSMISEVTEDGVTFLPPPHRFEAGTPAIAEIVGLGAALRFIEDTGFAVIQEHEKRLMHLVDTEMSKIEGVRRIGLAPERAHVVSFVLEGSHPSDVGAILDEQSIAVRAGHHCCQPLMRRFGIPGTVRASFSIYSTEQDVHEFIAGLKKAKDMLL
jgi:cysteine desulfurase/selenocysteine lyase